MAPFHRTPGQFQLSGGGSFARPKRSRRPTTRTASVKLLSGLPKGCNSFKSLAFGTIAYGTPDKPDKAGHEHLSGETKPRTDKDTTLKGVLLSGMSGSGRGIVVARHFTRTIFKGKLCGAASHANEE
jgi:hypothetical protein